MATWTSTYAVDMHPWFRAPSLKRKPFDDDDELSPSQRAPTPSRPIAPRPKRRRCDLERGFAGLTLNPHSGRTPVDRLAHTYNQTHSESSSPTSSSASSGPASAVEAQTRPPWQAPSVPAAATNSAVVLPGSIEEPTSPETLRELNDVQMKVPSWYEIEKDRIVITDLEDSDAEKDDDERSTLRLEAGGNLKVSPALMNRLSKSMHPLSASRDFGSDPDAAGKALVLFKPLVIPASISEPQEPVVEEQDYETGRIQEVEDDETSAVLDDDISVADMDTGTPMEIDDAMEIDPL
ncbi:hypothetical protein WOLCODRAFT_164654 [Wolfiporia cocos MD-104 SS10]|uniref:Uncharacterized protein n=1 Tax=Wolfiporia cocos (strain MD-104) TaxID=742152 RepID=A0A2H3K5K0_WOLCO|nr:hypothetical protein WOLCODRAFT_164654 [Wolfiporia cocos MD-104 SS10]